MVSGSEPPITVLCLHHFGGSSRTWDGVLGRLRPEYECITPDLRGFGDASETAGPYTVGQYADDVIGLVERRNLERFVLVGHSMGGKIATVVAARRPAGLATLILLAPSPPTPEPMTEKDRAETLAGYGNRHAALATISKITACPLPTDISERTADDMLRSSKTAWAAWLERGSREDVSADVEGLITPTLVLSGAEDRVIPLQVQRIETLPRFPHSLLVPVLGAGHLLPLEAGRVVADCIRSACQGKVGGL